MAFLRSVLLGLVLPLELRTADVQPKSTAWHSRRGLAEHQQQVEPLELRAPVAKPDAGYRVTQQRVNGGKPFIDAHNYPEESSFSFNLVPSFITLPGGSDAFIVRSVNGSGYQKDNGTASTLLNPDVITLTRIIGNSSDVDSIRAEPITEKSVIFAPQPGNKAEACGVQDPRVVHDKRDGTYYMTYAAYANPLPKDPKTNPYGIYCGDAWVGLASTKTPEDPSSWQRHGYNCDGVCGKSAAILIRDEGPHYMFWGIPTIGVAISDDLIHWRHHKTDWVVPDPAWNEMWIEAGSPPERLDDGNYLMTYNIADSKLWWGIGYLILDKNDPTIILQRGSHLVWPTLPWEFANSSNSNWEPYKDCIGAMNSLHRLPAKGNKFVGYYVAGDAVSAAALITVDKSDARGAPSPTIV